MSRWSQRSPSQQRFPWALQLKEQILKEQITDCCVFFKMPFRPCPSSCGRFLSADDGHDRCLQCLGFQHAEDVFVDDSCACCGHMSMTSLRSRLSFLKGLAPSTATRTGLSGSSRGPPADALGDLRVTVRASSPVCPHGPLTPHAVNVPSGSRVISLVRDGPWNTGRPAFHSMHHPMIGCRSQHRGMGLHPPDPELTAMLTRAAMSIGLEVNRPPGPEPSRLDDWILRAGHSSQPLSSPLVRSSAFFPLVRLHYPRWRGCQGVPGHSPAGESGSGALVPTKCRHLEELSASPVQRL